MKYLLFLILSLNAFAESPSGGGAPTGGGGGAFVGGGKPGSAIGTAISTAPGTTDSAGTGSGGTGSTATATSTGTSTGTDTSGTEALYEAKFGKDWAVTKQNDNLLTDKALTDEATKDANLTQEDANIMVSNTLFSCVEVAASGREDEVCQSEPNHPECTGVARALQNATNCLEYFTPASLGCKTYGTSEYSLEEWIAVGDQFQTKMVDCADRRNSFDAAKKDNLTSFTELIGGSNYLVKMPNAPSMAGTSLSPDSKISGSIKPDLEISSTDWETLASRVKDGASYLGYQDGDIVRASVKGESFTTIVTESPFAQKLNYENRAKLDEALADSKMIAKRVVQAHREKTGVEVPAEVQAQAQSEESGVQAGYGSAQAAETGERNASGGAVAPGAQAQANGNSSAQAAAPSAPAQASAYQGNVNATARRAMLEAERLDAVARAAAIARAENKAYRSPAGLAQAKVEDLLDTTLFHRISQAYRRKSFNLRTFDPRQGDLIRSIEKPEIFRSL